MSRSQSSPKTSLSKSLSLSRVRVHSPSVRAKAATERDQKVEFLGNKEEKEEEEEYKYLCDKENIEKGGSCNKVMVVVDSSLEAKSALEWTLSHTVQTQDAILLLHVSNPSTKESNGKHTAARSLEVLNSLKKMCQTKRPGVNVEVTMVEGKEKGQIIVEASKQQKVSLLVIGQRKKSIIGRFIRWWPGKRGSRVRTNSGAVDYCIQNASCMTIAVRKKNSKAGGYLITTKRHKNFWLLA